MPFRIFSLNLWNLNQDVQDRMQRLDTYASGVNPTIVCLQEVSPFGRNCRPQSDFVCTQIPGMARMYSSQTGWDERDRRHESFHVDPFIGIA